MTTLRLRPVLDLIWRGAGCEALLDQVIPPHETYALFLAHLVYKKTRRGLPKVCRPLIGLQQPFFAADSIGYVDYPVEPATADPARDAWAEMAPLLRADCVIFRDEHAGQNQMVIAV